MTGYGISQVAERTGFRPATLRYYEQIGLVAPPARTASGYRRYDERAVERLRFVARSKRLGLELDEIKDLVALWDADECAPVQHRLRELLTARQAAASEQIAALDEFRHELSRVADRLGLPATAGACGDHCACVDESPAPRPDTRSIPVTVDIACTLDAAEMPARLAQWRDLAARVVARTETTEGVRLRFDPGVSPTTVAELASRELGCCSFFRFTLQLAADGIELEIAAPPEARALVDALIPTNG